MNEHEQTLAALLDFAAGNPSPLDLHVIPIASLEMVLLADARIEGTMTILETVAGDHGRIVVSGAKPDNAWIGCLIEPNEKDIALAADQIREAYRAATSKVENAGGGEKSPGA